MLFLKKKKVVTGYDDMAGLYVCLMFMSVLVSSAVLKKSAGV